jgi:hypothetical protein
MLLDFLNILDILPDVIMASGLVSILGGMGTGTQSGKTTFKKIFSGENISITDTGSSLSISDTTTGGIGIGLNKIAIGDPITGITGSIFCTCDVKYAIVGDVRILSSESPSKNLITTGYCLRATPNSDGTSDSLIIGGRCNVAKGHLVVGGCCNSTCAGTGRLDSILGGFKNATYQNTISTYSAQTILGGVSNKICESRISSILGGYNSLIYGSGESSTILGTGSNINDSNNVSIINSAKSVSKCVCGAIILSSYNSQICAATSSMSISTSGSMKESSKIFGEGNFEISSNIGDITSKSKFSVSISNRCATFKCPLYSSIISSYKPRFESGNRYSTIISSCEPSIICSKGSSIITSCNTNIISSSFSSIISSRGNISNYDIQYACFSTMISSGVGGLYTNFYNNICSNFSILSRVYGNYDNYSFQSLQSTGFINKN